MRIIDAIIQLQRVLEENMVKPSNDGYYKSIIPSSTFDFILSKLENPIIVGTWKIYNRQDTIDEIRIYNMKFIREK